MLSKKHFDNAINRLLQTDYWIKLTEKTRLLYVSTQLRKYQGKHRRGDAFLIDNPIISIHSVPWPRWQSN